MPPSPHQRLPLRVRIVAVTDALRLVLLTAQLSPAAGGLAVSVPGLAWGMDRFDDLDVTVMGTRDPAMPQAARDWGPKVQDFATRGPGALHYAPGLQTALARVAPDVVDVQGLWTWPALASLRHARTTGRPYLVTPRGMLDPWALANSAWKKRVAARLFQDAHLRGACCLRATAAMEAVHFRAAGLRNPIAVVANGLDLPALRPRLDMPRRRLLFLSRLHPKKGAPYLLTAWAALHATHPDWELVIAGIDENGHLAALQQLVARHRLPRVIFAGPVHGDAKQQMYRDADLFVLPTHAENFGLVVAEALAQETPVITTTNAPWDGLERHGCGWWIPLDQARLTTTLGHAMAHPPAALAAMGQAGRRWIARDFGGAAVAAQMRAVYRWAAGRDARPDFVHD